MTELEKRVEKLEAEVEEMKKLVIVFKDPYKKELSDLKNAFMSGDKNLDQKILELEKRVEKLEILQNKPK